MKLNHDFSSVDLKIAFRNVDQLSSEEYALIRKDGIGASDIAAVLGINPYKTTQQLFEEKLNTIISPEEKQISNIPAVRKGIDLEPLILNKLEKFFNNTIIKPKNMYKLAAYPFIKINYDGVIKEYNNYIPVETKVLTYIGEKNYNPTKAFFREGEGFQLIPDDLSYLTLSISEKAGQYGIPVIYYVQLQTQMMGFNANYGYLGVLPEKDWLMKIYYIWKDEELQSQIIIECYKFWIKILNARGLTFEEWQNE